MTYGEAYPRIRELPHYAALAAMEIDVGPTPASPIVPAIRDAVNSCPDRGPVLPHPLQPEGCGKCGELSECRAGRGRIPGRVTLRDCLECRSNPDIAGVG